MITFTANLMLSEAVPNAGRTGALREAALVFLIVSLLLVSLFLVIAVVMLLRRRRTAMARERENQRTSERSSKLVDAWASAGQRAEPFKTDSAGFDDVNAKERPDDFDDEQPPRA